jgi:hypothetical protein
MFFPPFEMYGLRGGGLGAQVDRSTDLLSIIKTQSMPDLKAGLDSV